MARARGTTGRSTKATAAPPPAFAGSVLEDEDKRGARNDADTGTSGSSAPGASRASSAQATPDVTNTTLQRRELPSLSDSRQARIAEAAYWRAERRGFSPGHELDDWLDAEREIDGGAQPEADDAERRDAI